MVTAILIATAAALTLPAWASAQSGAAQEPGGGTGQVDEPILVEAETTQYQYGSEGTVVVASGNVRATHGDLSVSADYLRIHVDAGELLARGNVQVQRGSSVTRCTLFAYNLKAKTGRVLEPDAAVPGVYVRGKEMDVQPDRFTLADAHATGCDLEEPCYRVTTRRLVIYPDKRVVAEWPVLWLERVPVLTLPRLTLPVHGERVGWVEGEGYPVPRFGYASESGLMIGLTYLDRSREDLTIRYEGAWLTRRKGVQVQARADMQLGPGQSATLTGGFRSWEGVYASGVWNLAMSEALSLQADARYNAGHGMWPGGSAGDWPYDEGEQGTLAGPETEGGLTVRADAGPVAVKATARKDVYSSGAVYSLPAVEIATRPIRAPGVPIMLSLSGGAGRFEEPGRGVLTARTFATLSATTVPLRLAEGITCSLSLNARRAWYGTGDLLDTRTTRVSMNGRLGTLEAFGASVPRVDTRLGYTVRTVTGATPFAFDGSGPLNEAAASIVVRVNQGWTVGLATTYDLAAEAVKDVDLSLVSHHHCYDIRATWRERREEFGLEVRFAR
ncbi:MAG: hypothetical protein AB1700_05410 [Bacillota bacterium]